MNRIENLKSRWRPEWNDRPDLAKLSGAFNKALNFIEAVPKTRTELAGPGTLSTKGLNDAVRSVSAEKVIPDLRRSMFEVEKTAGGIKNDLARMAVPQPDKADFASALLRQEIRGFLRGNDKRLELILNSPELQIAAFEGPPELSGLTQEQRSHLERNIIEKTHGPAIEAIESAKEAVELTQAAIEMAIGSVRTACGFPEGQDILFNSWMATASTAVEREIAAEKGAKRAPEPVTFIQKAFDERFDQLLREAGIDAVAA
ncbi:hypothetical protein GCM10007881_15990 [Mesorhizobium huakuii]|uniref:hypothetical protein n=1 Tax=Mesorhizobium huakuii TaxID=28104 RepID=UPI00235D90A5|nr:hypothetical protein [Mesorhizobium huakuii]GLQ78083.1 hypothetical protein GCM10007881_15990 [Mesorhizobium huakuii]